MSTVAETCRTKSKDLTFVSLESLKAEAKDVGAGRVFIEIMPENFSNLAKDKFTDTRNQQTPKRKLKKTSPYTL